jgi:hypothetical protein
MTSFERTCVISSISIWTSGDMSEGANERFDGLRPGGVRAPRDSKIVEAGRGGGRRLVTTCLG